MIRRLLLTFFLCALSPLPALEDLPEWTEEDWQRLQEGEIVPGSTLIGPAARFELFADLDQPAEPAEPDIPEPEPEPVEQYPTTIAAEFLASYFEEKPGGYLVDPQHLLSMQELRDREAFLDYHARDSEVDVFFYLFDVKQELPEGMSARALLARHFPDQEHVAVVAYFMGMPEKTQIAYSDAVRNAVPQDARRSALRLAVEEALEKSDPTSQLESFSIQLSIRLYWMEKELAKLNPAETEARPLAEDREPLAEESVDWARRLLRLLSIGATLTGILLLAWWGRTLAERKRRYLFPDHAEAPALGGSHAGGVGGVLHYRSSTVPPSAQWESSPDYLGDL
ncbi:MAG: hypothetical protein ACQKBY_00620 [Verrucomicrobiales bacterium]